jgi:oligopeptidase B
MRTLLASLALVAFTACTTTTAPTVTTEKESSGLTQVKPPIAERRPHATTLHGETLVDDYFWFREKTNPEVIRHLEAENAYTKAIMKPTEELQKKLYDEMLARIKQTDQKVPYRYRNHYYYSRTIEGKQYPIFARKRGSLDAPEEILLDLNALAEGHSYLGLGAFQISDDENLLAYTTDVTGFRQYTLQVKDLRTGQVLPDRIEKTTSVSWGADNRTLFYVVEDEAKRPYRFYRHRLGSSNDDLLFEEKDALYRIWSNRSRSGAYIFVTTESSDTSEVRYLAAATRDSSLQLIEPRVDNQIYYADHHGDRFYLLANDTGKNFRLVQAPLTTPQKKNWVEVIPHRPEVRLEELDAFAGHLVISEREAGLPHLRVIDLASGAQHRLTFPEPTYTVSLETNKEFDTTELRIDYQSFVTPPSTLAYDMHTRERKLLKQLEVLGGYNPDDYVSERIYAVAPDGAKVPLSIVYKRTVDPRAKNPLLLYAYGSYGYSQSVAFSSNRLSLLDRGVVYVLAHIRGGGDLGKEWHDQGKMLQKKNTFTDFIAAAEHLIAEGYTSNEKLVISGGSAGGLLMGAVVNMRPDLFKAVVSHVPFVDVVNTMLDESLPLTVGEFLEWGNPKKKAEFDYIRTYDPYLNITPREYPAMLVTTSLNDSQVMYWEATKYVAKLRANKKGDAPLLLRINMGAGHGGASGRYDRLKEIANDYAFILWQVGAEE